MKILAINSGSSSIKFSLHEGRDPKQLHTSLSGLIEGLEPQGCPRLSWRLNDGAKQSLELPCSADDAPHSVALAALQQRLQDWGIGQPNAFAHRIVHGGRLFDRSVLLDEAALQALEELNPLAPLHQPHNIAGVRAFMQQFPGVPQVGCFDTAYHANMPALNRRIPLPDSITDLGVERYGFHGLSYHYISDKLLAATPAAYGKSIMAHLGSGASLCAAVGGRSQATTMSFSALDGLMMGSRPGNLDTGVLIYLMKQGWTVEQIETALYKQSGLLGVSGISGDMRTLRASQAPRAQEAIALFVQRIVQEVGSLAATIGGLDVLAFSGGIGENDAATRLAVCQRLAHLGLRLDNEINAQASVHRTQKLSRDDSAVEIWLVPTDEGSVAAGEALGLLGA